MKDRKKRTLVIGILCCLLVFMGVGFAVMNATLNINGTATAINTWSIVIDSITPIDNDTNAKSILAQVGTNKTEASFEVDFTKPGDYLEYEIVVNNEGSIDGYVEGLSFAYEDQTSEDNSLFKITSNAQTGVYINAGESISFKVKIEYDSNATIIPSAPVKFTLSANIIQKTAQGGVVTPVNTCEEGEINLAGECFHIMYEDDTSYTLLAKYNLLVGNTVVVDETFAPQSITPIDLTTEGYGLQNSNAKGAIFDNLPWTGTIAFADPDESRKQHESCTGDGCYYGYWTDLTSHELLETYGTNYPADVYDSNSKLYEHVENYESYLRSKGYNSIEARLMTFKEVENLGCVGSDNACTAAPSWVYSTTYWLGSAEYSNKVIAILSNSYFESNYFESSYGGGLRPVITILKSEV